MILADMFCKFDILNSLKSGLVTKGYNNKEIAYINGQLDLLQQQIRIESFDILQLLLKDKTYYRLLKQLNQGQTNLPSIYENPTEWRLCKVKEYKECWLDENSLIFCTNKDSLCFNNKGIGQQYLNNKWQ